MADVCEITGTSLDIAGDIWPDATLVIERQGKISVDGATTEVSVGEPYSIVTNASGVLGTSDGGVFTAGFALVQGWNYYVTPYHQTTGVALPRFRVSVPEGTTSSGIGALIVNNPVPSADSAALALAAAQAINAQIAIYNGRANLVTNWSDGLKTDGALISDGRVLYTAESGLTMIPDLPGLKPFGGDDLRHWTSADADGTTSVSSAVTAIIAYYADSAYFGSRGRCYVPNGFWLLTDTGTDPWFTIRDPLMFWGDGEYQSLFVYTETADKIFLIQPDNVTTNTLPLTDVDFRGIGFLNTTDPTNPLNGNAPVVTDTHAALTYDRAMGTLDECLFRDSCIDLLAVPESMRIDNCDTGTNNTGTAPPVVVNTAHIRIRPRQVDSAVGPNYQWTSGTGFDSNYYAYSNSVYINNHNMRAGAIAAIDQTECTILVEAVDGLYMSNGHVAWGTKAPFVVRPRHAQAPCTNIQVGTVLIDPLPGKSEHGVLIEDYWSQTTTVASDFAFGNCIIAGCTGDAFKVDLPMTGINWNGGAVKGVGTTAGKGFNISGGADNVRITDVVARNVGASAADPVVYFDDTARPYVDGLQCAGGTYGAVEVTSNAIDVVVGKVQASSITGGTTIVIPAFGGQVTVDDGSQIAETTTLASATTITPPLGAPGAYITGTTTIQTIATGVAFPGRRVNLRFASTPTLNETGNLLLGASSLKVKQGQSYDFVYDPTLNKWCLVGAALEFGTWTPVLSDGTNGATSAAGTAGTYTKVGDTVFLRGIIILSAKGSISGSLRITGLPFAAIANGGGGVVHDFSSGSLGTAGTILTSIPSSQSYIELKVADGTANYTALQDTDVTASTRLEFTAQYDMSN